MEAKICADLNSFRCFDFDYAPEDGDQLQVCISGQQFWFTCDHASFLDEERLQWRMGRPCFGLRFPEEPNFKGLVAVQRQQS